MVDPLDFTIWSESRVGKRRRGCLPAIGIPLAVIGVLFGWMGLRMFEEPDISRNYVAEFNARIAQIPEQDRAWPIYKQAILKGLSIPQPQNLQEEWPTFPGHPLWAQTLEYMQQIEPVLDLVRQAAALPEYGQELSDVLDPEIARAEAEAGGYPFEPGLGAENPILIGVLLPNLSKMRNFARDLTVDAYIAAEAGDGHRAATDFSAMLGMGHHAAGSHTLIGQLVQIAIEALAQSRLSQLVGSYPDLFTAEQLADLQHDFMTVGRSDPRPKEGLTRFPLDMCMEREMFYDAVQRVYTDDGHGNGHLAWSGMQTLGMFASLSGGDGRGMGGAAVLALAASRKETTDKYEEIMAAFDKRAELHPWERAASGVDVDTMVEDLGSGTLGKWRHPLIMLLMPALDRAIWTADLADARRDAAITILALARYRIDHGAYPETLDQLEPAYLPALPRDPVDGQPLRYLRTRDGCTLYSIGFDGDDDLGRAASEPSMAMPFASRSEKDDTDGDWVFFPEAMPKPRPPEDE